MFYGREGNVLSKQELKQKQTFMTFALHVMFYLLMNLYFFFSFTCPIFYTVHSTAGGKDWKVQKKDQQDWPFAYGKGTIVELKKR